MSFELAEKLKKQFTDKYVEVDASVPELKRFQGLTGVVKSVNMGGRALVQFDHPVDISWYDIEPSYLKLVDKPVKKAEPAKHADGEKKASAEAIRAAAKPAGKSPLEMARAQAASGAAKPAAEASEKPLSKIELARLQAAGGGTKPTPAAPTAPTSAPPAAGGKPLSKLEQARLQGAAGAAKPAVAAPLAEAPAPAAEEVPTPTPAKPVAAPAPTSAPGGKPLSKIDLARQQGAFKG